jgi:phosphatidylglycerol:prolipoprotein diacylglycerol transferase
LIDPIAFKLGPFIVRWYGLIIGIAVILGLFYTLNESKKEMIDTEFFLDFVIIGVPSAVVGARLYYVIFRWPFYKGNIVEIFSIWQGGLAIHGAIIAGFFVLIYLSKKYRVSFWKAVDILSPALVLGQALGRWGNFINQEAHGGPVSREFINQFPEFIKKQMNIGGTYYHPAFLYESLWNILIFLILILLRRKKFIKDGDLFAIYLISYSLGRFFIEGIRTDSLMLGSIMVAKLISIIAILIGLGIIFMRHRREKL